MSLGETTQRLEFEFERIHRERMHDVPILNHELSVEAVGFKSTEHGVLGVLITPWFMNLMLLPDEEHDFDEDVPGKTVSVPLPAGVVDFIAAHEEAIGSYRMCSLYSPVFEFADQDAATETASAVMEGIFSDPVEPEPEETFSLVDEPEAPPPAKPTKVSRRALFRSLAGVD
ncbi:MAG: [NiFe]-hydrogenase assembly chaperone HybE [Pseudomonadota bacterium]